MDFAERVANGFYEVCHNCSFAEQSPVLSDGPEARRFEPRIPVACSRRQAQRRCWPVRLIALLCGALRFKTADLSLFSNENAFCDDGVKDGLNSPEIVIFPSTTEFKKAPHKLRLVLYLAVVHAKLSVE